VSEATVVAAAVRVAAELLPALVELAMRHMREGKSEDATRTALRAALDASFAAASARIAEAKRRRR